MSKHFRKVKKHFSFAEKDIVEIQKMGRHTTVKTTERYLKSMGLLEDENAVSM